MIYNGYYAKVLIYVLVANIGKQSEVLDLQNYFMSYKNIGKQKKLCNDKNEITCIVNRDAHCTVMCVPRN